MIIIFFKYFQSIYYFLSECSPELACDDIVLEVQNIKQENY